jgi:hypothetical protein
VGLYIHDGIRNDTTTATATTKFHSEQAIR